MKALLGFLLAVAVLVSASDSSAMGASRLPSVGLTNHVPPGLPPVEAPSVMLDCEACHVCAYDPDLVYLGGGVSTVYMIGAPSGEYECYDDRCVSWGDCNEPSEDAEEALTSVLQDREALPAFVTEFGRSFTMRVFGSSLQIARSCGALVAWIPMDQGIAATVRTLLTQ